MKPAATLACVDCGSVLRTAFVGRICPCCLLRSVVAGPPAPEFSSGPATAGSVSSQLVAEGLRVGGWIGDYELLDVLGRGGMAVVYLARQASLDRLVALKTISLALAADAPAQERFRREARAVAQLDHPGIVAVHDAGMLGDVLFYTMDYIAGSDLGRLLRERSLPVREAAGIMRRVADAIGYAHACGIIHRDLKPANILLDAGGEPHVADFGLAFQAEATGGTLTQTGDLLGTPPYMPPETLTGGAAHATRASDVYALGAMLFQMLTGRTPFVGATHSEVLRLVLDEQPPSPRLLNPAVPRDLETICLKCLEKTPSSRYPDAGALRDDLGRFLAGEPIRARPVSASMRLLRWSRRRPALALVWCLVAALAAGFVAATVRIRSEQLRAESALAQTRAAEAGARDHLRDARLAEARAIRRTTVPGRRQQAIAALAEAARIRPGADLRDEALAALMLYDAATVERWKLDLDGAIEINLDAAGSVVAVEKLSDSTGLVREPAIVKTWGSPDAVTVGGVPGSQALGPLRFSADGKRFAESFTDETVRVWRVGERLPFATLALPARTPDERTAQAHNEHYAFTADGGFLVLGLRERGLALRRLPDGAEVARWEGGEVFDTITVSPDGRSLAAESMGKSPDRAVHVLTLPDLKPAHAFQPASAAGLLSWSGDSRVLAVGQSDGTFNGYDVPSGRLVSNLTDTQHRSTDVCFLGHDALLAVKTGTSLHLLNVASGREELFFNGIARSNLAAPPAGEQFTAAFTDGTLVRMKIEPPLGFQMILPSRAAGYAVVGNTFSLDFSPDNRWIASVDRGILLVYDARSGRLACDLDTAPRDHSDFGSVAFAADSRSLYQCSSTSTLVKYPWRQRPDGGWELGAGESLSADQGFFIADQSRDRQRLVLLNFASGAVRIVSVADGQARTLAQWIAPGVYNAAFSPDGAQVLVNTDGMGPKRAAQRVRIHRASDGTVIRELDAPVSCDVAWSGDGRTAITSNGPSESRLWDTSDWHVKATLKGELGGNVTTLAIAPDGSYAVVTRDDRIHLVSTRDGSLLGSFESPGATGLAASVRFQPDGKRFAVLWRDGRIDLIEPAALRQGLAKIGLDWTD